MRVGILGAGISGLSCAWLLKQRGVESVVFESRDYVGGLARSFVWHGFNCDFSSHRLFTLDENVLRQLLAIVPMGRHVRRSRIYLGGKWLRDPINVTELAWRFGPLRAMKLGVSYLRRPKDLPEKSFNDFVIQRYGRAMNDFVFRPYTERLFGISGDDIAVEWAKEKIRLSGPLDILRESSKRKFSYFYYPIRGGYGAIADALYRDVKPQIRLNCAVKTLETSDGVIAAVRSEREGRTERDEFDYVISTLPLTVLGRMLGQEFALGFRAVSAVYLDVNQRFVSDNHWVYFMDQNSTINRMVEFKNMSPVDCPPDHTVVCAEVTNAAGNPVERVIHDLEASRLLRREAILDTMVKQEPFGYPVYTQEYQKTVERARKHLGQFNNLYLVGRSAEFEHKEIDDNFTTAIHVVGDLERRIAPVRVGAARSEPVSLSIEKPLVYAVVLTYNHVEDTLECLDSLSQQTYKNIRVLVVDNGSQDNTPTLVKQKFPNVQVVETGQNLGVPWGYNIGFSTALEAGAEYVLMLNNDTILAPDMLEKLFDAATSDSNIAIAMPMVLYHDEPEVIWAAGAKRRIFPPAIVVIGEGKSEQRHAVESKEIEFAISCGLLIHRRAFEKVGLFDPGYFFYFDDWDFSERVRAHGLTICYVPSARMWHKVSRTTKQAGSRALFYQVYGESTTRFYRRHGRPVFISLPIHLAYIMIREAYKGNGLMLKHFLAGVLSGLSKPLGRIPSVGDVSSYLGNIRSTEQNALRGAGQAGESRFVSSP